ncbi:hypothetical protein [uncultured Psychrobacter sp.]|uniref:hypothetical protein n=1 Tax=uncultured Psychrobacter sp. TaxID=259303 RepID=UPI00261B0D27|nr:hypothetical protein [uncultured Psychrobacter sp.]
MPHRMEVVETARALVVSGSGTIAAVAMGLVEQLNVTHEFLNLSLPYWVFLLSMAVLNFVGAGFATQTDYMKANGSRVGNFFTAVFVGFFLSFVVLPTADPNASVGLMQIASFISGLCGTILLRVIINIMNRQDLQDAIVDLIVQQSIKFAGLVIKMVSEHAIKLIGALLIGIIASLTILPDSDSDNSQQQSEVRND